MSSSRAKKVKMATKSCPECDQQVPVACKSCPCGYIFISRKLLHAKRAERSPPITENKSEAKRRRTERVKREKINSAVNKDLENRKRSRSNSHSDHSRRGRGRPKSASAKKHEEERALWPSCCTTLSGNEALVLAVRGVAGSVPTLLDQTPLSS
uniref:C16orf87 homolog n=1 Tax=Gallus gallus TaxID=9031 RepID=A0A8V1A1F9_CHICK